MGSMHPAVNMAKQNVETQGLKDRRDMLMICPLHLQSLQKTTSRRESRLERRCTRSFIGIVYNLSDIQTCMRR